MLILFLSILRMLLYVSCPFTLPPCGSFLYLMYPLYTILYHFSIDKAYKYISVHLLVLHKKRTVQYSTAFSHYSQRRIQLHIQHYISNCGELMQCLCNAGVCAFNIAFIYISVNFRMNALYSLGLYTIIAVTSSSIAGRYSLGDFPLISRINCVSALISSPE